MRLLVPGSRYWSNGAFMFDVLDKIHAETPITCIIEGCAPGADWWAGHHIPGWVKASPYTDRLVRDDSFTGGWALRRSIPSMHFPADWYPSMTSGEFFRGAGPVRNKRMLVEGRPDRVVFFHEDLPNSRGTKNMVEQTIKAGIPYTDAWKEFHA